MKNSILTVIFLLFGFTGFITATAQDLKTENVILVTADGLRIQEMFGGMDETIVNDKEKSGIENTAILRGKFSFDTPKERREALLPFFWKELIQHGVVLGNQQLNSTVKLRNEMHFSYPGYAEIITGMAQPKIVSNMPVQNPVPTAMDFIKDKMGLSETQIAAVCSWNVFSAICSNKKDSFFINAGYEDVPEKWATEKMKFFNEMQKNVKSPWDSVRHDAVTFNISLEWLKTYKPKMMYIALGETDDWAHARRYDRVLETANYFDMCLQQLWTTLESMEEYQGKTTLIITTDHGRGVTTEDWTSHSAKIPGADDIWIAVVGPDTPNKGELSNTPTRYQASTAATLIKMMGLDWKEYNPKIEPPLAEAFE